jgi:hypothetical protein
MVRNALSGMEEGNFDSDSGFGYSVDNIVPSIPQNFAANFNNNTIRLIWDDIPENDLQYYALYRDDDVVGNSSVSEFVDPMHSAQIDSKPKPESKSIYILNLTTINPSIIRISVITKATSICKTILVDSKHK